MKKTLNDNDLNNVTGGNEIDENYEGFVDAAIDAILNNIGHNDQTKMELANDKRNEFDSMCNYSKDAVICFINDLKNYFPEVAGELDNILQEITT